MASGAVPSDSVMREVAMRIRAALTWIASFAVLLSFTCPAFADDGDDNAATLELLSRPPGRTHGKLGQNGGWQLWWYANRTHILEPSYRAATDGDAVAIDSLARNRARDALRREIDGKRELVRSEAVLALGRLGDVRDFSLLARIVSDPEVKDTPRMHRWAAVALGLMPLGDATDAAQARDALLSALRGARGERDHFSFFWAHCALALAMRGDASALPELITMRREALSAKNARSSLHVDVLGPICYAMAVLGGDLVLPEVREHLSGVRAPDSGSKDTSWAACHALARIDGDESLRLLRDAASDRRYVVRRVALTALGSVAEADDDETARVLREVMKSESDFIARQMGIVSLGRSGHASARDALLKRWKRCLSADRTFVATALGLLARERPDPVISKFLHRALMDSHDEELTRALAVACGLAKVDAARSELIKLVRRGNLRVCASACAALGYLGVAGANEVDALLETLDRKGSLMRMREASLALGLLRQQEAVAPLWAIAGDRTRPDMERAHALSCLGRVGSDTEIDEFLSLLEDRRTTTQLRACVIHGLGLLLDRDEGATLAPVAGDALWFWTYRGKMYEAIHDIQRLLQ